MVGTVAKGRAGFGSFPSPKYSKAQGKERRWLVQEEVRAAVGEIRSSRMAGMRQQGAWMRWESAMERRFTSTDIW